MSSALYWQQACEQAQGECERLREANRQKQELIANMEAWHTGFKNDLKSERERRRTAEERAHRAEVKLSALMEDLRRQMRLLAERAA